MWIEELLEKMVLFLLLFRMGHRATLASSETPKLRKKNTGLEVQSSWNGQVGVDLGTGEEMVLLRLVSGKRSAGANGQLEDEDPDVQRWRINKDIMREQSVSVFLECEGRVKRQVERYEKRGWCTS